MRLPEIVLAMALVAGSCNLASAQYKTDSITIKKIYNEELSNGRAYEDLRYLCKNIGARISGSKQAQKAVEWSKSLMESYGFDTVYLQQVMVPNWKRGKEKELYVREFNPNPRVKSPVANRKIKMVALGGSVGTNGKMNGELVEVKSMEELRNLSREKAQGKIVFINLPMDPLNIFTFYSYGGCVVQRVYGADEASKLGAKGVIIRSCTMAHDDHPHTGTLVYNDSVPRIPAAAISTQSADWISAGMKKGFTYNVDFEMNCRWEKDTISYNVVGEIRGSDKNAKIIAVGGHLDSWDVGEGAHDDGAGCVHSIEALRLLKQIGYKPKNTLRAVMFMNEENGSRGGMRYAEIAKEKGEQHLAAIESDAGGNVPRGFSGEEEHHIKSIRQWAELFKPYAVHYFEKGWSGVDIGPLREHSDAALIGFVPDSQRYFDYHHSPADVFENVHQRELELGCATIAALVYLIDKYGI